MPESRDQPTPGSPSPEPSIPDPSMPDPPMTVPPSPEGSGSGSAPGDAPAPQVPTALTVVSALVLLEAATLVGLAIWWTVGLVVGGSTALGVAVFLVVFCLAVAAALVGSVRVLRAGRRGGRAPVVTWQLLQAATALTLAPAMTAPASWAAWLALAVAAVVAVAMMTRPVVVHTVPQARQ